MLPESQAVYGNDEYSPDTVQAKLGDESKSDAVKTPLDRAIEKFNQEARSEQAAFVPTSNQWKELKKVNAELLEALRDAQVEIEQLTAENLKLHEASGDLHSEIAHLKEELAALKQQL